MSSLDGETYSLSAQRGEWVVVNFWATWCGPCREEMPILQAIHEQFEMVTVLGINQRESVDEVRIFVDEFGISFPVLLNPGDQTLIDYNVMGLPQTVVVNPDGVIVHRQFGPVELDTFSALIADLINDDDMNAPQSSS